MQAVWAVISNGNTCIGGAIQVTRSCTVEVLSKHINATDTSHNFRNHNKRCEVVRPDTGGIDRIIDQTNVGCLPVQRVDAGIEPSDSTGIVRIFSLKAAKRADLLGKAGTHIH